MFNSDNLPHELFLTRRQITKLRNNIENNMSTDITLSKAQIKKIIMSGGALGSILGTLLPSLIKVPSPILKIVALPLGLSGGMSGIDGAIQEKKIHGSGTTVIFSNEQINDMTKIVKALEDSDILLKRVTETLKNYVKKGGALPILPMILSTLGSSLIGNSLSGRGLFRSGKEYLRAGQGIKKALILPKPHPLTNFEIQNYYKNEPKFNGKSSESV